MKVSNNIEKIVEIYIHANDEKRHIGLRAPTQGANFALEGPSLHLATDKNLPKAYDSLIVPAGHPRSVRTDVHTSYISSLVDMT